jgi:uncharacterized protein YbjT (DUF2867 family)
MKVLIAGANGITGYRLVRLLAGGGHEVRAMIRDPAQAGRMEEAGAEPFVADLEGDPVPAAKGREAIFFCAGGGRGSSPGKKDTVDHMGAVKLIEAAEAGGAERFILLSSIRIEYPETWPERLRVYLIAKEKADRRLMASGLGYTIVRPGRLTDEPGTGLIAAAESRGGLGGRDGQWGNEITRDDTAAVMAACLGLDNTRHKAIEVLAGEAAHPRGAGGGLR